ncbi:MAG: hypothetical protein ACTSVY_03745 [Candidatus Helarchaeota archaeon]
MLDCSKSTISRIFQQVVNALNGSTSLSDLWTSPKSGEAFLSMRRGLVLTSRLST